MLEWKGFSYNWFCKNVLLYGEIFLDTLIKETEGLQSYELALLAFIIGEQMTDDESIAVYEICSCMTRVGYNGNEYPVCSLTQEGVNFVLKISNYLI